MTACLFRSWSLGGLAGVQTTTGPGGPATGTWEYKFNVCANVVPVPTSCTANQVLGTVGLRYDGTLAQAPCEQLGPDINLNPDDVEATKQTGGEFGLKLKWTFFPLVGSQKSLTLNLFCNEALPEPPSVATSGNDPEITWRHEAVCVTGPGGGPGGGGGGGGGNLIPGTGNWGAWVLGFLALCLVAYVGGGVYVAQKDGKQGLDALPHIHFWTRALPAYVADGVYFTRSGVSQWHPSLAWMAPSRPPPRGPADEESLVPPPAQGRGNSSKSRKSRKSSSGGGGSGKSSRKSSSASSRSKKSKKESKGARINKPVAAAAGGAAAKRADDGLLFQGLPSKAP